VTLLNRAACDDGARCQCSGARTRTRSDLRDGDSAIFPDNPSEAWEDDSASDTTSRIAEMIGQLTKYPEQIHPGNLGCPDRQIEEFRLSGMTVPRNQSES